MENRGAVRVERRWGWLWRIARIGALVVVATACSGGGRESPTSPTPPPSSPATASFRIVGVGVDQSVSWASSSNLIFCRRDAGWADLWMRFAEQTANNGANGPHLDIDLCNHGSSGTFVAMDPQAASCGANPSWGVWWHAGGVTYVNPASATSCTLVLDRNGTALSGTFECRGLRELGGDRVLDLVDGSFQCTEQ